MKKFLAILISLFTILSLAQGVFAVEDSPVEVPVSQDDTWYVINGKYVDFNSNGIATTTRIYKNTNFMPIRAFAEAISTDEITAKIKWAQVDGKTLTRIIYGDYAFDVLAGSEWMDLRKYNPDTDDYDFQKSLNLKVPAELYDNTMYIPFRKAVRAVLGKYFDENGNIIDIDENGEDQRRDTAEDGTDVDSEFLRYAEIGVNTGKYIIEVSTNKDFKILKDANNHSITEGDASDKKKEVAKPIQVLTPANETKTIWVAKENYGFNEANFEEFFVDIYDGNFYALTKDSAGKETIKEINVDLTKEKGEKISTPISGTSFISENHIIKASIDDTNKIVNISDPNKLTDETGKSVFAYKKVDNVINLDKGQLYSKVTENISDYKTNPGLYKFTYVEMNTIKIGDNNYYHNGELSFNGTDISSVSNITPVTATDGNGKPFYGIRYKNPENKFICVGSFNKQEEISKAIAKYFTAKEDCELSVGYEIIIVKDESYYEAMLIKSAQNNLYAYVFDAEYNVVCENAGFEIVENVNGSNNRVLVVGEVDKGGKQFFIWEEN